MNEKILNFAKVSTLAVLLAFGITQVSSWTAPTAVPPNGNVYAPINVGNATQTKAGNLTVGSLTSNGDIDATGDNLINVATPIAPADGVNKAYVDAQAAVGGGGNGGGGDNDFVWGYTDKHYFVTASAYNGNLGGISGANTKCNTDANAIPGKAYHFVSENGDPIFNAPGVGLYNDEYGWVNSVLKVIPLGNGQSTHDKNLLFNRNYSGIGNSVKIGSASDIFPYSVVKASDASVNYRISSSPSFWLNSKSQNCSNWTSTAGNGQASSIGGYYIGDFSAKLATNCLANNALLCVEN